MIEGVIYDGHFRREHKKTLNPNTNELFIWAPKLMNTMATASLSPCVFTILGVNQLEEITNLRPFYLELHWYVD